MTRAHTFIVAARVIDGKPTTNRRISGEELRSFKGHYGARPEVCLVLLRKLRLVDCRPKPKHLLWALCFLKTYSTEDLLAKKFHTTCKTLRKHVWAIVPKIAALSGRVVRSQFVINSVFVLK